MALGDSFELRQVVAPAVPLVEAGVHVERQGILGERRDRRRERGMARREALHHRMELQPAHAVVLDRGAHDAFRVLVVDVHSGHADHVGLAGPERRAEAVQLVRLAGGEREQQVHDSLGPGRAQVGERALGRDVGRYPDARQRAVEPPHQRGRALVRQQVDVRVDARRDHVRIIAG